MSWIQLLKLWRMKMLQDSLSFAKKMMKRRKFSKAIILLESREENYYENFDFYLTLGICYLYAGNYGSASSNFQKARSLGQLTNVNLILGQAVLFLRRGDTERAIHYYMEVLEYDPQNKIALSAMEFIRKDGDYSIICKWVDSGKIEKFFPKIGISSYKVMKVLIPFFAAVLGVLISVLIIFSKPETFYESTDRPSISHLNLTSFERKSLSEEKSVSDKVELTASEIEDSYEKILKLYNSSRDNACQVEINRILNSNAIVSVKQKARIVMDYLEKPDFSNIKDVPDFKSVSENPYLYLDCWVNWSGRVSNVVQTESLYECNLLIGYEELKNVEGIVPVKFFQIPEIDAEKPVQILGKISEENGKIYIEGNAVFQSVKGDLINP